MIFRYNFTWYDRRFYNFAFKKYIGQKNWPHLKFTQVLQKNFSVPQQDTQPVEQNLEVLEGKDKKEFLKGRDSV